MFKIAENIYLVKSKLGFTYCNCILVEDKVRAIIDTGADYETLLKINPETIDLVLYTHHHYDHTRGHKLFHHAHSLIHKADYPATLSLEAYEKYNSIDIWDDLMPNVTREEGIMALNILPSEELLCPIDNIFIDKDVFNLGDTEVQVIHTPGHSAGHSAFYFPKEDFLFTGDICLTAAGPWYGELLSDPDDMINSINKIIELNPRIIASCHVNEVFEDSSAKLEEFKNRIYKRDERIYNFLKNEPADIHKMADNKLIYKFHPSPFVVFWEKLMLIKHIERLEKMGVVAKTDKNLYIAK
ncbi:MAG: MBL fold metallo-hydrolase [Syntrophomonadaceae bacterium]|nr:MBL fold metallo-hydrolase [Syntrophomonadaceae bacterium]